MSAARAGPVEANSLDPIARTPGRLGARWLWLALAFAFAPTLLELAGHLRLHPAARAVWIFPVLTLLLARRDRAASSPGAWAMVVLGAVWQLMALAADAPRLARPGVVLAAIGLCRATGMCRWSTAGLLLFAIPLPHVVAERLSPALEKFWADRAVAVAGAFGGGIERIGEQLSAGGRLFTLQASDGGLALVWLGLGFAWCARLLRGERAGGALAVVATGLGLGFAAQLVLLVAIAIGLVLGVRAETLRMIQEQAIWLGASAIGLLWAARIMGAPSGGDSSTAREGARAA